MTSRLGPFGLCGLLGWLVSCSQESPPDRLRHEARAPAGYAGEQLAAKYGRAMYRLESNTDSFAARRDNDFYRAVDDPLSTFSIDVDTASYSVVRRFLNEGRRPPADAVRVEELINYFPYEYSEPAGDMPFSISTETASAPWQPQHRLLRIGLRAPALDVLEPRPDNLVFLIDVSGSMQPPDRLPLLIRSMQLLVERLDRDDVVSIVVYAGSSGVVLPPTSGERKAEIA